MMQLKWISSSQSPQLNRHINISTINFNCQLALFMRNVFLFFHWVMEISHAICDMEIAPRRILSNKTFFPISCGAQTEGKATYFLLALSRIHFSHFIWHFGYYISSDGKRICMFVLICLFNHLRALIHSLFSWIHRTHSHKYMRYIHKIVSSFGWCVCHRHADNTHDSITQSSFFATTELYTTCTRHNSALYLWRKKLIEIRTSSTNVLLLFLFVFFFFFYIGIETFISAICTVYIRIIVSRRKKNLFECVCGIAIRYKALYVEHSQCGGSAQHIK